MERLEGALVHITDVLVLQSERMDYGSPGLREEMNRMREESRATREETRIMRETVTNRLDRLIAITTKERPLQLGL